MEKPDPREAHDHPVAIAGFDHLIVPDRAAGFCHVGDSAFFRPLDIVSEGEECIRSERHPIVCGDPGLPLLFRKGLGSGLKHLFPGPVPQDILLLGSDIEIDRIITIRTVDPVYKIEI